MKKELPSGAKVVIIGGGIAGCSVAYHLAKFGWKDVVLLERDQLTSGTTWHAAGLVSQLGATATITKLRKYSLDLYKDLEKKTELSSGLKLHGAISIATTKSRLQELLRQATTAQLFDVGVEVLDIKKIKELYPIINEENIVGGIYMPLDGQADPVGVTNVLAKAAKMEGAKIIEKCPVDKILTKNGRIAGVKTSKGVIDCEYIVLTAGMWSRQIAEDIGVSVPLYPNEHFYILTEPIKDLPKKLPVLRDFDACLYLKEDAGKLLVGIFEPNAKPAFKNLDKIPNDFSFGEFPEDFEHFEPYLSASIKRLPLLEKTGIRKFFVGPESFTPDTSYLLGEVPEVRNFYVCCGFNSIGIASAGGAGRATAEWMMNGHINEDLFSADIRRFEKFNSSKKFIMERVTETLGDLYGMHWPYKQHKTSRNQKLLPYHEELKKAGACFGAVAGYERPMWFIRNGAEAKYEYSFNYQNWYPSVEYETINTRKNIGLFDLTPFSKFELKGPKAHVELQCICTANIKNEKGRTSYTQMLNKDGGIESDLTVVCLDQNYFRVVSSAAVREHDKHHILKHLDSNVEFKDVTGDYACLGVFGPKSRNLMTDIAGKYFETKDFSFATGKNIKVLNINLWVQRLSYVGELGWELYIPTKDAKTIYNKIIKDGAKYQICHAGVHAMDTLRMEKGYLHWGHDITPEENQYEAGLGFAISYKKNVDFIGKDALLKIKDQKPKKKLVILSLKENRPGFPLLLHDEPILSDGKIIGRTTSGNYSFNFKKNMAFGYVNSEQNLNGRDIEIEVEKTKYKAIIESKPLHDPDNRIIKN
ncbi:MAG: sarcosine dehydrogenase [Pelagibacteraceae bacterium]|nr:MAG: sarcosine dehydrogenase [Pelagibacteraceae bacterium]